MGFSIDKPPQNPFSTEESVENPPAKEIRDSGEAFEFKYLKDQKIRDNIRNRTQALIRDVAQSEDDYLIFLDKSARPFAWLLDDMWESESGGKPKPQIRFMNVGTSRYAHETKETRFLYEESETLNESERESLFQPHAAELRRRFGKQFDGKKVRIVDDVQASGTTLDLASAVLKEAFPGINDLKAQALFPIEQQKNVPWIFDVGYQGVLELGDEIFARSMSEDNVKATREKINRELEGLMHFMLRYTRFGVSGPKDWGRYVDDLDPELAKIKQDKYFAPEDQALADTVKARLKCLSEPIPYESPVAVQREYFQRIWDLYEELKRLKDICRKRLWDLYEDLRHRKDIDEKASGENAVRINEVERLTGNLANNLHYLFDESITEFSGYPRRHLGHLFADARSFSDRAELARRARLLRSEIRHIASDAHRA
jgi:hypothetical protein